jgi:hypothetical protein
MSSNKTRRGTGGRFDSSVNLKASCFTLGTKVTASARGSVKVCWAVQGSPGAHSQKRTPIMNKHVRLLKLTGEVTFVVLVQGGHGDGQGSGELP